MAPRKPIYLTYEEEEGGNEGYWNMWNTLGDAAENKPGAEIFIVTPRLLGRFKMKTKPHRIKRRKPRK